MKKIFVLGSLVLVLFFFGFSQTKTWTVDNDRAQCPDADFTHPQDAMNVASPGDTIKIYPGVYYPQSTTAPNVVVNKDGITIVAADADPTQTVLIGGHNSAISIIASDVTVSGLKFIAPGVDSYFDWVNSGALVMIGALSKWGPTPHLESNNNAISKCVFGDLMGPDEWGNTNCVGVNCGIAIQISFSSDNTVLNNTAAGPIPGCGGLPVFVIEDSFGSSYSPYSSKNNKIINNDIYNGAITIGIQSYALSYQVDNSGTKIHGNKVLRIVFENSCGRKIASGNVRSCGLAGIAFWVYNSTDYVIPGNANHGWPPGWVENGIIK